MLPMMGCFGLYDSAASDSNTCGGRLVTPYTGPGLLRIGGPLPYGGLLPYNEPLPYGGEPLRPLPYEGPLPYDGPYNDDDELPDGNGTGRGGPYPPDDKGDPVDLTGMAAMGRPTGFNDTGCA